MVKAAARPETNRLSRTICGWRQEIEMLIVTDAGTLYFEVNTSIKNIERTARGAATAPRPTTSR